jgi:F-type H+-transporting ATPase subunit delta
VSGTGGATLGAVYAEALAEAAEAKGVLPQVGEELAAIAKAWSSDREFRDFFLSGGIRRDAKEQALEKTFRGRAHDLATDFLRVLLSRGRLFLLPDAADAMTAILNRRLGRVPVTIQTAVPVTPEDLEGWRARIRAALGKEPVLTHRVRPALIGGAVVTVGDVVADGSVRRRLADLRSRALNAAPAPAGANPAAPSS